MKLWCRHRILRFPGIPCRFKQAGYSWGPVARDNNNNYNDNNRRNANLNNRPSNRIEMTLACILDIYLGSSMKTYRTLYPQLCSYENLELAFRKARKKKTTKQYVIDFESNLKENLNQLKHELETFTYTPSPLTTFTVRDPKTRRISASHFRDRIVHHALCNIIGPIFEKRFIHDSFANQKGKGTHSAIRRFEKFMHKVSSTG
jgi:retron-type reverse transcriptase